MYFFWERSSFIFHLKNNIEFSGKRNIIFPDDTRKIIFECDFFGKIIFSKHLEKENMVFRAVSLWKYYRDKQNNNLTDCESFKSKIKIIGNTPAAGNTKDVKIAALLK